MNSKPNYLIVAWHINEDERTSKGHILATAETLRWARQLQKRIDPEGWYNSSIHHADARWSLAFLPAWGALPVEAPSQRDAECPF